MNDLHKRTQLIMAGQLLATLTQSMVLRQPVSIRAEDGVYYDIVNRIEVESGSGFSYNVTLADGTTIFVKV
jgi:hypothetical protein